MLSINDYVNYSVQGICKIEDIRSIRFKYEANSRDYYILRPINQENTVIYVPVDNPKLIERTQPILSPDEIDRIISETRDESIPWISDCKERALQFNKILSNRDKRQLLLLAKCLYTKSKESRKGLAYSDGQIPKRVEAIIEQEFSFSLKISKESIGEYIRGKLGLNEQEAP